MLFSSCQRFDMRFRIDDSDNRAVGRNLTPLKWEAGFLSSTPENQITGSGADRIDSHQRLPGRPQLLVENLNQKQLTPDKRVVFNRRYDVADDTGQLHSRISSKREL